MTLFSLEPVSNSTSLSKLSGWYLKGVTYMKIVYLEDSRTLCFLGQKLIVGFLAPTYLQHIHLFSLWYSYEYALYANINIRMIISFSLKKGACIFVSTSLLT